MDSDRGGAIYIDRTGSGVIDNNTFVGNDGSFGGGAIYAEQQDITIRNNLIRENHATTWRHLPGGGACGFQVGAFGVGCVTTPTRPATWGQVKSLYLDAN